MGTLLLSQMSGTMMGWCTGPATRTLTGWKGQLIMGRSLSQTGQAMMSVSSELVVCQFIKFLFKNNFMVASPSAWNNLFCICLYTILGQVSLVRETWDIIINNNNNILCSSTANLKLMLILTYSIVDNYKDALSILKQYQNGCNTSDLQSEAEHEVELPDKRNRKPV